MLRIDALPFHEAIRAALARRVVLPDEFYGRLQAEARQVANTVSRLASIDQISQMLESLVSAERAGQGFREWRRDLLASTGGFGLTDAPLETIYRTNTASSCPSRIPSGARTSHRWPSTAVAASSR